MICVIVLSFIFALISQVCLVFVNNYCIFPFILFSIIFIIFSILKIKNIFIFFEIFSVLSLNLFFICNGILFFKIDNREDVKFVYHAGGGIDGKNYLDCIEGVEGIEQKFSKGGEQNQILIELDFLFTSDRQVVCSHELENFAGFSLHNRIDYNSFNSTLVHDKYHGITLDWLYRNLEANNFVKIILDTKEKDIVDIIQYMIEESREYDFEFADRFIVQIYNFNDYDNIARLGITEIWFSNYKKSYFPMQIEKYFKDKPLVTTYVLYYPLWKLFRSVNFQTDKKIAVHTINNKKDYKFASERGVDYVFTDVII